MFILGFKKFKDSKPLGKGLTRSKATVQEMNGIRTALREAGFDPSLVGTQNGKFVGDLLGTIDRSFKKPHEFQFVKNYYSHESKVDVGLVKRLSKV